MPGPNGFGSERSVPWGSAAHRDRAQASSADVEPWFNRQGLAASLASPERIRRVHAGVVFFFDNVAVRRRTGERASVMMNSVDAGCASAALPGAVDAPASAQKWADGMRMPPRSKTSRGSSGAGVAK